MLKDASDNRPDLLRKYFREYAREEASKIHDHLAASASEAVKKTRVCTPTPQAFERPQTWRL